MSRHLLPFGSQRKNDLKVSQNQSQTYALLPQIPVGGRLRLFLDNWQKITSDQWVISTIKDGYKLEFLNIPAFSGIRPTVVPLKDQTHISQEIDTLLQKDAIEKVDAVNALGGFYSTFFLVPKKNGKLRPVINLRPLNKYLAKKHFKMDTLSKVINLVRPQDWAITIDLTDAYLHIPIFQKHRKFLRFCFLGQCYQWKVMCFGPTSAPRVFTKLVSVVAAYLRTCNVRLAVYLDDWLGLNQKRMALLQDRKLCLNLLVSLGFMINLEKSNLEPSQKLVYIGALFNLKQGLILPTDERFAKIQVALSLFNKSWVTAQEFLHLLGLMASCIELVPNARLFMRPIQMHLLCFWTWSKTNSVYTTPVFPFTLVETGSQHSKGSLIAESFVGDNNHDRCFQNHVRGSLGEPDSTGVLGLTATKLAHKCSGDGSNFPDSEAFSISSVSEISSYQIRQYDLCPVHKQTGGHSFQPVMHENLGHLELCNSESNDFEGSPHLWEGQCSSRSVEPSENIANRMVLEDGNSAEYFLDLGSPIDGSICIQTQSPDENILHLVPDTVSVCSRCSVDIMGEHVCICLSPNMSDSQSTQTHVSISVRDHSDSTQMATQTLVHRDSAISDCSSNTVATCSGPVSAAKHTNISSKSGTVSADGMETVDRLFKERGFSEQSRQLLKASWRKGTRQDYNAKFRKFCSWCRQRQINTNNANLINVSDFLTDLFHEGLQYRTIAGYRSMLSVILPPIDGIKVGQHPDIVRLIKGVFNSRPPQKRLLPEWNLETVLSALQKKPFEPLKKASLKLVTYKTVFLIAISCFRRCSDLQSLRLGEGSVSIQSSGITFSRHGLAKQDREGHYGTNIFIPSFEQNKKLDPKRSLYYYLKKTEAFRHGPDGSDELSVFLGLNEPHKPVSSQTISGWIVQTLKLALNDKSLKVKGHSTRAIGASYALFKGASLSSILAAADWSRESTFMKFYLRDMSKS